MSDKQTVLEAINQSPRTYRSPRFASTSRWLESLREGLADSEAGRVIDHEEVKKRYKEWATR